MEKSYRKLLPIVTYLGFIGIVDTSFITPIISAYAKSLGASIFQASLIAALYSIIAIPVSVLAGFLIDYMGRKRLLMIGLALDILILTLYVISPDYLFLALVRAFHAAVDSFLFPASIALVGDFFIKRLGFSLSLFWTSTAIGIVIGSGSASLLVGAFGFSSVFMLLVFLLIVALIIVIPLKLPEMYRSNPSYSMNIITKNIAKLIPSFFSMFSIYFIIGAIIGSLSLSLIFLQRFIEQRAAAQVGIYMFTSTMVSIPFFFLAGRISDKRGANFALIPGLIFGIIASIFLYLSLEFVYRIVSSLFLE